jgi:hypothetical protein
MTPRLRPYFRILVIALITAAAGCLVAFATGLLAIANDAVGGAVLWALAGLFGVWFAVDMLRIRFTVTRTLQVMAVVAAIFGWIPLNQH